MMMAAVTVVTGVVGGARPCMDVGGSMQLATAHHLALAHGHAWAVPEALRCLGLLVIIMPAGAQGGAELVLVLRETLDDHCRH